MTKLARLPKTAEARARRDRGRAPAERPIPARLEAATSFAVPDRLLRDPRLSVTAKLVGFAVCAAARDRRCVAVGVTNEWLSRKSGLSARLVQCALVALERAGWVHRLHRGDALTLDSLELAGYVDPWERRGRPAPARALVLLWRLPPTPSSLVEGVGCYTPRDVRPDTPDRAEGRGVGR